MADWHDTANRALNILSNDSSDEAIRTAAIINHVLDDNNADDYISKDFYNVQQTAGGLPDTITMDQYLTAITGHVRDDFGYTDSGGSFDTALGDGDFKTAVMSIDANIRHHITFLNGVVHNAAPGQVHLALWQKILDARKDDRSIYACYRDYLVDA